MKHKETENNKNIIKIYYEFDKNEINALKNRAYLESKPFLTKSIQKEISKKELENLLGEDYFNQLAISAIAADIEKDALESLDVDVLVNPVINNVEINDDGAIVTLVGIQKPSIELFNYKEDLENEKFEVKDLEDLINAELESIQKSNVRLVPSEEPINEDNVLSLDMAVETDEGEVIDESKNVIVNMGEFNNSEIQKLGNISVEDFIGKNVEDQIKKSVENGKVNFVINQIYNEELPEIDDDFAAEVSEFDTLDEFKDSLKNDIIADQQKQYNEELDKKNLQELFSATKVDIDEEFLNGLAQTGQIYQYYVNHLFTPPFEQPFLLSDGYLIDEYSNNLQSLLLDTLLNDEEQIISNEDVNKTLEAILDNKEDDFGVDKQIALSLRNDHNSGRLSEEQLKKYLSLYLKRNKAGEILRSYTKEK